MKTNSTDPGEVARVYAMTRANGHLIDCTRIEGTRDALLAEAGAILKGVKWPKADMKFPAFWDIAQFHCTLIFIETDDKGRPVWRLHLSPMVEALKAAVPAGMRSANRHPEHTTLLQAARADKMFRSLKRRLLRRSAAS